MKNIKWSQQFSLRYKQRISKDAQLTEEFWESIEAFNEDPQLVSDHALQNTMQGKRAFSVNDDYRIVYIERDEYLLFLDVGTHEQVYIR